VPLAVGKQKFLSNPAKIVLYTAANALQNKKKKPNRLLWQLPLDVF
jgi:hypothetical protein